MKLTLGDGTWTRAEVSAGKRFGSVSIDVEVDGHTEDGPDTWTGEILVSRSEAEELIRFLQEIVR